MPRHVILAAVAALAVAACGKPECKTCDPVGGAYLSSPASAPKESSSCGTLAYSAPAQQVQISQEGTPAAPTAALAMRGLFDASGTLYEDKSASFYSTALVTSDGTQATASVSGQFSGTAPSFSFKGTIVFVTKPDGCTLSVPLTLQQTGP